MAKNVSDGIQVILLQVNFEKKYKLSLFFVFVFEFPSLKTFLICSKHF